MKFTPFLLSTALALAPTGADAQSRSLGGSIARSVAGALKKSPKKAPPMKPGTGPSSARSSTANVSRVLPSVSQSHFDHYFLMQAGIAGAQYAALSPTLVDRIAYAQYHAMMNSEKEKVLPRNHPTVQRVERIVVRLIDAVNKDPQVPSEIKKRMKWDVKVIEKNMINAFCMPGGKMAIYTSIINTLKLTDDEIAVIMGHEIEHALRDHGYQRMKASLGANAMIGLVGAKTGSLAGVTALNVRNSLWQLSHSRDHEREADHGGLRYVRSAGYDVCAGERVWAKMGALSKSAPPPILSTHPPSREREANLAHQAREMGAQCR